MLEIKDPAIKIFGKEIPLPADSEVPLIETDDSDSSSEKETPDGAVQKVQFSQSRILCVLLLKPEFDLLVLANLVRVLLGWFFTVSLSLFLSGNCDTLARRLVC